MTDVPERTLLVTHPTVGRPTGGRSILSGTIAQAARSVVGDEALERVELQRRPVRGLKAQLRTLRGEIDGVDSTSLRQIQQVLDRGPCNRIILDGSNLGRLARKIKKHRPAVRIVTVFHNVEARFFLGALRASKKPRALGVLWANYVAERQAVKHSDLIVCLNRRDSEMLARIYRRGADAILPMALPDNHAATTKRPSTAPPRYMLFVGGAFYANLEGARWLIREVLPRVDRHLVVVGHGMERLQSEFQGTPRLTVIGSVEDVGPWYRGADFVVAPIFDGSGMKTKVAEALMHGKHVVGTHESFVGYEEIQSLVGAACGNAEEFVRAINGMAAEWASEPEIRLREAYCKHHSAEAAVRRLGRILEEAAS